MAYGCHVKKNVMRVAVDMHNNDDEQESHDGSHLLVNSLWTCIPSGKHDSSELPVCSLVKRGEYQALANRNKKDDHDFMITPSV